MSASDLIKPPPNLARRGPSTYDGQAAYRTYNVSRVHFTVAPAYQMLQGTLDGAPMTLAGLFIFAAAYVVTTASPEPGIAAVVARVLAKGTHGMPCFIAGFVVGDLIWFSIAATGLNT